MSFLRSKKVYAVLAVIVAIILAYFYGRSYWVPLYQKFVGKRTIEEVVKQYSSEVESRLIPKFKLAGISFPPQKLALLAIKDNKQLELWASSGNSIRFIDTYPILAASGALGPKLREGDWQVPEGIYQLESLNPNSSYHLSMKLNYPNQFDLAQAAKEGRGQPGSNIFIHGKDLSVGCLAIGDKAIEELFVLVAGVGLQNVEVAIAPKDPRNSDLQVLVPDNKAWVQDLYKEIAEYFKVYAK